MEHQDTCQDCMDYKNGDCAGTKGDRICKDFHKAPSIPQEVKDNWPKGGDASTIRRGGNVNNKPTNSLPTRRSFTQSSNKVRGRMNSKNSPQSTIKPTQNKVKRVSYTYYSSGMSTRPLRKFTVVLHREKGIAIKMEGLDIKCIDIEKTKKEKLALIFMQFDSIKFPHEYHFSINATDGDAWKLNVDGVIYTGYFVKPEFVARINEIIGFSNLYKKYDLAFEAYVKTRCQHKLFFN